MKSPQALNSLKALKTIISRIAVLLLLLSVISSCSKDEEPPKQELEALVIDCSTSVAEGDVYTLEDRNDGVDYIIDCVYVVSGDFVVNPGVTIQFGTDAGIRVYNTGSIQLLGTSENQVVFTGEDKIKGSWKGIFIQSNDPKNTIAYTSIEYAGGEAFNSNGDKGAIVLWSNTRFNMNNTSITNSSSTGLNARYGGDELTLENNTITNCNSPMHLAGSYPTAISGGSYTGNTLDAIIVDADQITGVHTWKKINVPFHLSAGLQVIAGGKFTVMPGVIMKFGQDSRLSISEGASGEKPNIVAVGTETEPIVFTSIDNTLSGWRGIWFDTPSTLNEIGFARIENASNAEQDGAIEMWYGTVLNVHDVLFKDIQNCAIFQYVFQGDPITLTTSNLSFDNVGSSTLCQN